MLSDEEFKSLMDKARSGDADAARELVELYEPEIRRVARVRLSDPKLRRIVDSMDICQSVFAKFFQKARSPDGMDLENPGQLLGFLVTMTRNRVIDEHRHQTAQKRNAGEGVVEAIADILVADSPGPRTEMELGDLMAKVRSNMSEEELAASDLRGEGLSWDEVAQRLGGSPDSHRKRLERAFQRIRTEMTDADGSVG